MPRFVTEMRCDACGHDMLPEDIAQRPLVDLDLLTKSAFEYNKVLFEAKTNLATRVVAVAYFEENPDELAEENPAELIEASRRMRANRWRIWPILAGLILFGLLSVLAGP